MRIGLREANQRFSTAIKAVKAGEEVVLNAGNRLPLSGLWSNQRLVRRGSDAWRSQGFCTLLPSGGPYLPAPHDP